MTKGTGSPLRPSQALGALLRATGRLCSGFHEVEFDAATRACMRTGITAGVDFWGHDEGGQLSPVGFTGRFTGLDRGMIAVGKLQRRTLDEPRRAAIEGVLDVVVDRAHSVVSNPFNHQQAEVACQAFHLWLVAIMMLDDGSAAMACNSDDMAAPPLPLSGVERDLLGGIAVHCGVRLHESAPRVSAPAICAWLWHHARLLMAGRRLRLLCRCCDYEDFRLASPFECHAVTLACALQWLISTGALAPTSLEPTCGGVASAHPPRALSHGSTLVRHAILAAHAALAHILPCADSHCALPRARLTLHRPLSPIHNCAWRQPRSLTTVLGFGLAHSALPLDMVGCAGSGGSHGGFGLTLPC